MEPRIAIGCITTTLDGTMTKMQVSSDAKLPPFGFAIIKLKVIIEIMENNADDVVD